MNAAASPRRHGGWRHRLGHSLQGRLVALFLLLACGTTALFVAGTRDAFSSGWRELVRPLLSDYVDRLALEIGSPPDVARARAIADRLPLAVHIDGPAVQWQSQPPRDGARPGVPGGPRDPAWRELLTRHTADGHRIRFSLAAWRGDDHPRWWHGAGWWPLAGLLVLTAAAFAYVRRLFKPLDDIRAGAMRFGEGQFSPPIPLRRHDQLGELGAQVNTMAGKLQGMLEGQRALLLAISHELRSPLTRARLNAELVADGAERDALLRDLNLMRDLIADLLESERLAGGHAALQRERCDLNALVREQLAAAAADAGPAITAVLADDLPALSLDRSRIQLLLRNLLANARLHGQGQPVEVGTRLDPGGAADDSGPARTAGPGEPGQAGQADPADASVVLWVRDHGPGVPPDQLDRLAQPFARPDAARSRGSGGVGLGLYLCRLVAQTHGGQLRLRNAGPGLEVTVRLPLAANQATDQRADPKADPRADQRPDR